MTNAGPRRRQRFCAGWARGWSRAGFHSRAQLHGRPLSLVISGGGARTHRRPRERKSRGLRTGLVVFVLILAACSHPAPPGQLPPNETSPGTPSPPAPGPHVGVTAVKIPSIGLDDNLTMEVDLNPDHTLGVPPLTAPRMVGWFRQSPVPGDATCDHPCVGAAVLAAHVNSEHVPGAFADLAKVKVGAGISALRSDGQTAEFKVTRVLVVAKSKFPTDEVYGPVKSAQLVAITCGPDAYNPKTHNYENQTIVWAKLVSLKPTGP